MATTTEKKQAPAPKAGKKGEKAGSTMALDAAPKARIGRPRLQTHYESVVRPALAKEFGLEVPKVSKPANVDSIGRQWTDNGDDKPTKKK